MKSKSFKIGWIILILVYCIGIVSALLVVFTPMSLIGSEIEAYTGTALVDFVASYKTCYSYMLLEILEQGIFMFGSYFVPLLIMIFAFRKLEKWAWYAILASWIINTLATIGGNFPTGDMGVVYLSVALSALGFVGLGLSAKAMLGRSGTTS